jgi:hypothetical protein
MIACWNMLIDGSFDGPQRARYQILFFFSVFSQLLVGQGWGRRCLLRRVMVDAGVEVFPRPFVRS